MTSHAIAVTSIVRNGVHSDGRRTMARVEVIRRRATKVLMTRREVSAIIAVRAEHLRGRLISVHTSISLHLRILLLTVALIMSTIVNDHTFTLLMVHHPARKIVV